MNIQNSELPIFAQGRDHARRGGDMSPIITMTGRERRVWIEGYCSIVGGQLQRDKNEALAGLADRRGDPYLTQKYSRAASALWHLNRELSRIPY